MNVKLHSVFLCLALLSSEQVFGQDAWVGGGAPDPTSMNQANNWLSGIPSSGDALRFVAPVNGFNVVQNISNPFNLSPAASFAATPSIFLLSSAADGFSFSGFAFAVQSGFSGLISCGGGSVHSNTFACPISVPSGSTLYIGGNNADVFSGVISGDGSVEIGHGPVVLQAVNTYTGATTLSGNVTIAVANAIPPASILAMSSSNGTGTLTLNADQSVTINSDIASGSQVTIGAHHFTVTNLGSSVTWASSIQGGFQGTSGPGGTFELGAGSAGNTLALTNGNTYSVKSPTQTFIGNTIVSGGTLQAKSESALGQNSNLSIAAGAMLDLSPLVAINPSYNVSFNQVSGAGSLLLGSSTAATLPIVFVYDGGVTFSGSIDGKAGITYAAANTWTLSQFASASSYVGPVILSGGGTFAVNGLPSGVSSISIQSTAGSTLRATQAFSASTPMTFALNGVIDTQAFNVALGGVIQGGGGLQKNGAGTLTLSANNSYSGPTTVAAGTLSITNAATGVLNSAISQFVVNSGTLNAPAGSNSLTIGYLSGTGGVVSLGSNTLQIRHGDGPTPAQTSFAGLFSGSGSLSIAGTLTASTALAPNTHLFDSYTGPLTLGITGIDSGTLAISTLGTVSQLNFSSISGTLHLTDNVTFLNPVIIAAPATGTFQIDSGKTLTLNGAITGISGTTLATAGSGTVVLNAANAGFVGAVNVGGGTLRLTNANALGSATTVKIASTGTLDLNGHSASIEQLLGLVSPGDPGAQVTLGAGTLTIMNGESAFPFYGTISGAGNVVLKGAGTSPTFIGTNTYAGTTTIQEGVFFNTQNLGSSSSYIFSGGSTGGGTLTIGSSCTSTATISINAATPATFSTNTYDLTLSGNITSADATASFIKNGEGTLTLTGDNTGFTGVLTLQGGILNVPTVNALGNPAHLLSQQFCATLQAGADLALTPNWIVATTGTLDTNGHNVTYSGNIIPQAYADLQSTIGGSLFGGFNKTGVGVLTLTGTNTYNGTTSILNGTLVANPTSFPTSVTPEHGALTTKVLIFNAAAQGAFATFKASSDFADFPQVIFFSNGTIDTDVHAITANHIISGGSSYTITKAGAGTLTFSGANIYTGPTHVTAGTLQAGVASTPTSGAFGVNSAITVDSGKTLALNGFSNAIGTLAGSGNVTLGAATLTISNPSASSLSFSGPITDGAAGGGLTISSGSLALTGANNYSGTTTIAAGATLSLNNAANSVGTVSSAGTLTPLQPVSVTNYTQTSTGTLDLSNILTYPGTGVIDGAGTASFAGTLILSHQLPSSNAVLLQYVSRSGTFGTVMNLPSGTTISYDATQTIWDVSGSSACAATWSSIIAGNWGATGNWSPACAPGVNNAAGLYDDQATLSNLPGHPALTVTMADSAGTAAQDVTLGLLVLGDTAVGTTQYTIQAFGGGTTGLITMGAPSGVVPEIYVYQGLHTIQAPLALSKDTTILSQTADAALTISGAVTLGSSTLTMQNNFASPTGVISISGDVVGSGGMAIAGGTLNLTGSNGFTGGLAISNGAIAIVNASAAIPSTVTFTGPGTLRASAGLAALPAIVFTDAGTLDTNGFAIAATGVISGSGSLTKAGAGVLTVSGANIYTGATTVSAGTLLAGVATTATTGAFGVGSAVTVSGGATLGLGTFNNTVGSITGAGSVNLGSGTLTISNGGGNTLSGAITGSGGLTLLSGIQILSDANGYTGTTQISGGTLRAGVITNAFGSSSPVVLLDSGVLDLDSNSNTIGSLSSSSTTSSVLLGSGTLTINAPSGQNFQGVISGTGGVTLNGSGTQTLGGANTYTGATAVSAGTLQAAISSTFSGSTQTSGAFGVGSTVTVSPGAFLALANNNQTTIGTLSGAGAGGVTLGSSAVLTIANGGAQTFSGAISGSGGIALSSGVLTLSGGNGYLGPTTVTGGTLKAGSATAFGSGSTVTAASAATLDFQGNAVTVGDLANYGTVLAGNTIHTATYTQDAGAVLNLTITAPGVAPYGNIISSGALVLSGTLDITTGGSLSNNIVLLQGSSRSGRFTTPPAGYSLQYSPKTVSPATVTLIAASCTGKWISSAASAYWNVSGNWEGGCIPGISSPAYDVATFDTVAHTDVAVSLSDGSAAAVPLLTQIVFDTADTSFTIQPFAGGPGSFLQFEDSAERTPTIDVLAGSHTINANIEGETASVVGIINLVQGTQLTLGGNCSITNLANLTITDEGGAGTLVNNGYIMPSAAVIEGNTITNAGWIATGAGDLTIQGTADVTNTGLLYSFASFSMSDGSVANQKFILSDTAAISGGTLVNSGDLSTNSIVMSGGSVTNTGLITTLPFVLSGGSLTNSGLITTSTFTETGSAQMNIGVLNVSSFGAITADTASVSGSLVVTALPGFAMSDGQTVDLITAAGGVTPSFTSVSFQNFPANTIPSLVYLPGAVQLDVREALPVNHGARTHAVFNSVVQHNCVITTKCQQLRHRMSPPPTGQTLSARSTPFSEDDLIAQNEETAWEPYVRQKQEQLAERVSAREGFAWNVYAGPVASAGSVNTKGSQIGMGYSSFGALTGCDYVFSEEASNLIWAGLGAILEYRKSFVHSRDDWGSSTSDRLHGSLYSTVVPKSLTDLAIEAILGFAYNWDQMKRHTGINKQSTATGRADEKIFDCLLGVEYQFSRRSYVRMPKNLSLTPLITLQYINDRIGGYTEHGAGIYSLRYDSHTIQSLTSVLGTRIAYLFEASNFSLRAEIDAGWQREYLNRSTTIGYTAFNVSSAPLTSATIAPGRNSLLLGIDWLASNSQGWQLEGSGYFQFNSLFYDTFFYLGFGKEF
ncbi:MAG: pmpB-B [Parachlamydiales bacterium]|nr:pmpB-B [Parachlamydiales bacterium]